MRESTIAPIRMIRSRSETTEDTETRRDIRFRTFFSTSASGCGFLPPMVFPFDYPSVSPCLRGFEDFFQLRPHHDPFFSHLSPPLPLRPPRRRTKPRNFRITGLFSPDREKGPAPGALRYPGNTARHARLRKNAPRHVSDTIPRRSSRNSIRKKATDIRNRLNSGSTTCWPKPPKATFHLKPLRAVAKEKADEARDQYRHPRLQKAAATPPTWWRRKSMASKLAHRRHRSQRPHRLDRPGQGPTGPRSKTR